ncbi:MAG TPA: ATP-binding cassette domain-containing protein [Conexibacter sp.]|nr:ATP-binding cassette domain-containing protein [Conexibacter sp.]
MTTLVLEGVGKRFRQGATDRVALDGVSLEVDAGEVVGVWGRRRSGRTTLLRVAAGVEQPDRGTVHVDGVDLWNGDRRQRRAIRQQVAVWYPLFLRDHGRRLYRQVAIPTRRGRRATQRVWADAHAALERVGIGDCARTPVGELDHRETIRAALARALVMRPRLLVLDEPMAGVDVLEGERLMELLIEIARADRIAMVVTAAEVGQLAGVDRHLSIAGGALRGATAPTPADVIELRRTESRG